MVWGTLCFSGTMEPQEVQGHQTAAGYVQMLQRASLNIFSTGQCYQRNQFQSVDALREADFTNWRNAPLSLTLWKRLHQACRDNNAGAPHY